MVTIREMRELRGMSVEQLARDVGVKPRTLSAYERGEREIPRKNLEKAAEVLDVCVGVLKGS